MSKLFKLKQWLTIPQTAKYLSSALSEEVTEADVLRLGLDRHLKLSVCFLNGAYARPWVPVNMEEIDIVGTSPDEGIFIELTEEGDYGLVAEGEQRLRKTVVQLDNVAWDLPLTSAEQFKVSAAFNHLMNIHVQETNHSGSSVTSVASPSGDLYQLQKRHGVNPLVDESNTDFVSYLLDGFSPAQSLPDDSILVVRTKVLSDWLRSLSGEYELQKSTLQKKVETTYKNIIGGLVTLMLKKRKDGTPYSVYSSQSAIIDGLETNFPTAQGLSKRNLEIKFKEGKDSLDGTPSVG